MRRRTPSGTGDIAVTDYRPPPPYSLDLEIFPVSVLRRRATGDFLRKSERIRFHLIICVTSGHCTHMVDFRAVECRAGTVLTLHPGQVQRYDAATGWHGWLVLFRPEFLQSQEAPVGREDLAIFRRLDALPAHLQLDELERDAVVEGITRMFSDAQLKAGAGDVQALLRSELHATIIRLRLVQARRGAAKVDPPALVKRFRLYSLAVEEHFQTRHAVANYARLLGCSQKSLGRAVQRIAGVSAKAFLSQRIALEAKRLLVHTALPVATIAHRLGFDEPTNFVKFFRREARKAPGAFRSQYKSRSPSNTNARQPTI